MTLAGLTGPEEALEKIRLFSDSLQGTKHRLAVFSGDRAIVRTPILQSATRELGFAQEEDMFALLQGDIVMTEAAYYFGERVTGSPRYAALNASCDLVPDRRNCPALLRIKQIRGSDKDAGAKLNLLLRFKRSNSMYLPVLPGDGPDVLCNVIEFDGFCQIRSSDLQLANRVASLSLAGWRIFAAFSSFVISRANPREGEMRRAIEQSCHA
jgi:hypothetical protein